MTFLPVPILLRAVCVGEECVSLCDSKRVGKIQYEKRKISPFGFYAKDALRRCWHRNGKKKKNSSHTRRTYSVRFSMSRARSHSHTLRKRIYIFFSFSFSHHKRINFYHVYFMVIACCLLPLPLSISSAYIIVIWGCGGVHSFAPFRAYIWSTHIILMTNEWEKRTRNETNRNEWIFRWMAVATISKMMWTKIKTKLGQFEFAANTYRVCRMRESFPITLNRLWWWCALPFRDRFRSRLRWFSSVLKM